MMTPAKAPAPNAPIVIENEIYQITYDGGYLQQIRNKKSSTTTRIPQQGFWFDLTVAGVVDSGPSMCRYKSTAEKNSNPSGAYIFPPNISTPDPVSASV